MDEYNFTDKNNKPIIDSNNLNSTCRACLGSNGEMVSIFSKCESNNEIIINNVKEMLMSFTLVQIVENDGLPSLICTPCLQHTLTAFSFKQQCENSDAALRNIAQQVNRNSCSVKHETTIKPVEETRVKFDFLEPKVEIDDKYAIKQKSESLWENKELQEERYVKENLDNDAIVEFDYGDNEANPPLFPCPECIQCFTRQKDLRRHLKAEHAKNKALVCDSCDQSFANAQTLARHKKIHQENQKNKLCTFCGKCFMRSDDLKRHTRIHTGERPYSCDQCPKNFKQSSELKEHIKSHLTTNQYMCTECGKSLATRNGFYVHMKVHRGEKNHECKICGNRYVTTGELTSHVNHIHTQTKRYVCSYEGCCRAFVTKLSLETHLRTHTGEKPFRCATCGKCLATASSLHEHKRTHTGEKTKKCTVCSRSLGNSQALKKHMRIHTGERPYQCKLCAENFICGSALNTHMKIKHLEKQHQCPVCHKMFALGTKLRQHMRLHADEKPFSCKLCGMSFKLNTKLAQHMKSHELNKNDLETVAQSRIHHMVPNAPNVAMAHLMIPQYL